MQCSGSHAQALGCLFFELLFLESPFDDNSRLAILSGRYTVPKHSLPAPVIHLLRRMLTVDPKHRASIDDIQAGIAAAGPLSPGW